MSAVAQDSLGKALHRGPLAVGPQLSSGGSARQEAPLPQQLGIPLLLPSPVAGKGCVVHGLWGKLSLGWARGWGFPWGGPQAVPLPPGRFCRLSPPPPPRKVIFWGWVKTCSLPWVSVFLGPLSGLETCLVGPFSSLTESRLVAGCPAQGLPGIRSGHLEGRWAGADYAGRPGFPRQAGGFTVALVSSSVRARAWGVWDGAHQVPKSYTGAEMRGPVLRGAESFS